MRIQLDIEAVGIPQTVGDINHLNATLKRLDNLRLNPAIFKQVLGEITKTSQSAKQLTEQLAKLEKAANKIDVGVKGATQTQKTAKALNELQKATARSQREAKAASTAYLGIAKSLGTTFGSATQLVRGLGLTAKQTQIAVKRTQEMKAAGASNVQVYRALQLEVGLTAKQYRTLNGAVKTAAAQQQALKAQQQAAKDAAKASRDAAKAQQQAAKDVAKAHRETQQANDAYLKLSSTLGISVKATENFTRKLGLTGQETAKLVTRLQKYQKAGVSTAEAAKRISKETGIARGKIAELGNAIDAAGKKSKAGGLASFFKGLAPQIAIANLATDALKKLGQTVTKFVGDAIKEYAEFEQYLAEFSAIGGGESEETLKALEDRIRELGATTQKSAQEIASITPTLKRAGLEAQQTINILPALTKASIATGKGMEELSDGTLQAINVFKKGGSETEMIEVVDTFGKAADSTRTSYTEMTDALVNAGGSFKLNNVNLKDGAFILQNFAEAGQRGAEGGTAAKKAVDILASSFNVLSGRVEPTSAKMQRQADALAQLGISSDEAKQLIESNDWEGIWRRVTEGLAKFQGTGKDTQITMELFGQKMQSKVALALSNSKEKLDEFSEGLQSTEGYMDKVSGVMADTLSGAAGRFNSALGDLKLTLGGALEPLLRGITEVGAGFTNLINGALKSGFNTLATFIEPVSEAWENFVADIAPILQEVFGTVQKVWGGFFSEAGPAIEEFSQAFGDRFDAIGDIVVGLADAFSEVYQIVEPLATWVNNLMGKALGVGILAAAKRVELLTIPFQAIAFVINKIVDNLTFVRVQMAKLQGKNIADPFEEAAKALDSLKEKTKDLEIKPIGTDSKAIKEELKQLRELQKELREVDVVGGKNRATEDKINNQIKERVKQLREAKKDLKEVAEEATEVDFKINSDSVDKIENTELDPIDLPVDPKLDEEKLAEIKKKAQEAIDLDELDAQINLEERIAQNPTLNDDDIALEEIRIKQETIKKKLELEKEGTAEYKRLTLDKLKSERDYADKVKAIDNAANEERQKALEEAAEAAKKAAEERQKALEEEAAKRKQSLEKELNESRQIIEDSETERKLALAKLKAEGASDNQIERQNLQYTKDRIDAEIALEEEKIAKFSQLKTVTEEQAREKEQTIREAKRKTVELSADLINNQIALEENAINAIIEKIQEQARIVQQTAEDSIKAKQEEIQANELLSQSLDRQKALLESKSNLLKAQSQLTQTQSQIEIEELNRAIQIQQELASGKIEDANIEKTLRQELASLGIKKGQEELDLIKQRQAEEVKLFEEKQAQNAAEFEQKHQTLVIEAEQNRLQQERLILQAEETQLQAELNRLKAEEALVTAQAQEDEKAIGLAQKQLEIADKEIALSQRKLENARAENSASEENLKRKRQQLEVEKKAAKIQSEADKKNLINRQNLERAKVESSSNRENLEQTKVESSSNRENLEQTKVESSSNRGNFIEPDKPQLNSLSNLEGQKKLGDLMPVSDAIALGRQNLKDVVTQGIKSYFPQINIPQNESFSDEKMVNELQGVRQDLKSLIGVTANQKLQVTNNYKTANNARSEYGKQAVGSVGL